ncbi:hypothetical protein HCC30_11880 [Streptomyces sp. HNM0574]|nr:hypothetical protein [Streptomyces sp. HNM0574]
MAFSADELRVLRGALTVALQSQPVTREYAELARAVDETARESGRLRSFLLADLARYRAALPGSATGYLEHLQDALNAGYLPRPDDLAALRTLSETASSEPETRRRTSLLRRCERLAGRAVRARLLTLPAARDGEPHATAEDAPEPSETPDEAETPDGEPAETPEPEAPAEPEEPSAPAKPSTAPGRPVPTPAEVFPPRRRTPPPPEEALSA